MKKWYAAIIIAFLLPIYALFFYSAFDTDATVSDDEQRELATMPALSLRSVLSGDFGSGFETYYADTFPFREKLLNSSRWINGLYAIHFGGESSILIDPDKDWEHGGSLIDFDETTAQTTAPVSTPTTPPETTPSGTSDVTAPTETTPTVTTPATTLMTSWVEVTHPNPESPSSGDEVSDAGAILMIGNAAMEHYYGVDSSLEFYADSINKLNKALPDVQVYAMFCPTSIEFNAPAKYQAGIRSQLRAMNYAYSHLDVGIAPVDTWSSLYAHRDEYIYFRTDHHWTQLGAYYAYTAFCEAAGFDAVPLEQFQTGRYDTFLGSMYTFTKGYPQSDVLKQHPDYLDYYRPIADTQARYYADGSLENGTPVSVVYTQLDESVSNKYLCFIGGDTPVCIVESDVPGPTCIVLKESYGNAFVPFLTSHYGRIIVIDPREFNRDGKPTLNLTEFAADQGVDDLIVINYPYMINSKAFIRYLNALAGVQ